MPSPIRALLFLDDESDDNTASSSKKKPRTTTTTLLRDGVARSFLSKWSSFLLSRKTTEISIPVAFDKQKSNFLIGPSALWWRDAFAISSSLLRGGDDDGEDNKNNSEEKEDDAYENDDAAMADLGHAAEATLDLARVVSGTLLADLRRCAMLISFFLPFAFEFDSSGGVLRVYLVLLFVSRGVLSSTHFVRTRR